MVEETGVTVPGNNNSGDRNQAVGNNAVDHYIL